MEFLDVSALPVIGTPAAAPATEPARPRADAHGKEFSQYLTGVDAKAEAAATDPIVPTAPVAAPKPPTDAAAPAVVATATPAATNTATPVPATATAAIVAPGETGVPQVDAAPVVAEAAAVEATPTAPTPNGTPQSNNSTKKAPASAVAANPAAEVTAAPQAEDAVVATVETPNSTMAAPIHPPKASPQAPATAPQADGGTKNGEVDLLAADAVAVTELAVVAVATQQAPTAEKTIGGTGELALAPDAGDVAPMPSRSTAPHPTASPTASADAQGGTQSQTNGNGGNQGGNQFGAQLGLIAAKDGAAEAANAPRLTATDFAALAADAAADVAPKTEAPQSQTNSLGALAANEASTNPIQSAKAPATAARAHFVQPPPTPAAQVAVSIAQAAADGARQIGVRLNPEELGRVEVKLDISRDGRVSAMVIADRADTLALLKDDASALEQALEEAGLDPNQGGLQFGLREQGDGAAERRAAFARRGDDNDIAPAAPAPSMRAGRWTGGLRALDISV